MWKWNIEAFLCVSAQQKHIVECFCGKCRPLDTNINATMTDLNERYYDMLWYNLWACVPSTSFKIILSIFYTWVPAFLTVAWKIPMRSIAKVPIISIKIKTINTLASTAQLFCPHGKRRLVVCAFSKLENDWIYKEITKNIKIALICSACIRHAEVTFYFNQPSSSPDW